MAFICPDCGSANLEITDSIEVAPDSWWDEIAVQIVKCSNCAFLGAAVYQESRRGSLDSEAINHYGIRIHQEKKNSLVNELRACPAPRNIDCPCAAHRNLGRTDESGRWAGVGESIGQFTMNSSL